MVRIPVPRGHAPPPPGTEFVGAFRYVDDFYNYLSYAQQAQSGSLAFRNKVLLDDHRPALVNLEWSLVGGLGRLLGGRLILAYRVFGLLAAALLLLAFDLWLTRLGLPASHRLPALLLLTTGGGLGGLLFTLGSRPMPQCLDLYAGLFPSIGLLFNPHFVAGTALLALALLAYERDPLAPRDWATLTLLATAIALVRPYDFVLLGLIRAGAVLLLEPARGWWKGLLPLATLLPAVAYLYWLFYLNPAFSSYAATAYAFPAIADFAWALSPAVLLGAHRAQPKRARPNRALAPRATRPRPSRGLGGLRTARDRGAARPLLAAVPGGHRLSATGPRARSGSPASPRS